MGCKITRIVQRGNVWQIHLSEHQRPLVVGHETLIEHHLKEGIQLTPSQVEILIASANATACDNEISRLLTLREHSSGELIAKLKRKKFDSDTIKTTLHKYRRLGLLDDNQTAENLARRTLARKPCGRAYLMAALQRKMYPRDLAERIVTKVFGETDPDQMAVEALKQKWPSLVQFDLETARRKAYNYLSRRGISYAAAKAAFELLAAEEFEDNDRQDR